MCELPCMESPLGGENLLRSKHNQIDIFLRGMGRVGIEREALKFHQIETTLFFGSVWKVMWKAAKTLVLVWWSPLATRSCSCIPRPFQRRTQGALKVRAPFGSGVQSERFPAGDASVWVPRARVRW
jgi:hypothetical protein